MDQSAGDVRHLQAERDDLSQRLQTVTNAFHNQVSMVHNLCAVDTKANDNFLICSAIQGSHGHALRCPCQYELNIHACVSLSKYNVGTQRGLIGDCVLLSALTAQVYMLCN